jgi:ABC-type sugar transport system substrate-binding protein
LDKGNTHQRKCTLKGLVYLTKIFARRIMFTDQGELIMFIFKKFTFLIVIASMALAACQPAVPITPEAPTVTKVPATNEIPEAAGPTCSPNCRYSDLVIGFLQTGSEGGWRAANTASFKESAEQLGLALKFYDSQNEHAKQVAGFQQFIQDPEVNVIVLAALEASGWEEILQQAKDAGKIVVLQDRRIDAPDALYSTYIGSDFTEEGRKAGTEMCKLLEGSESKNVWEIIGNERSSSAIDRGKGFRETAAECGIEITNSQTANWSLIEGKQVTEAWLKESKDVQGIFAQNDEMGFGAIEAVKEAGLAPAVDVKIISVDATAGAFQAMLDGTLNVTVECNPLIAPQVYEAALAALNGETLPKWIPSIESVFYADDPNLAEIAAGRTY